MNKVLVISYEKKSNGRDTVYLDGIPQKVNTIVSFPMEFGYRSYNEPQIIKGTNIQVADIVRIENIEEIGFIG